MQELDSKRQTFAISTDEDERARLTDEIISGEKLIPYISAELDKAVAELQRIEMDFLFKGVVIDPDKLLAKADRQVVSQSAAYTFTRITPGDVPAMEFEVTQPRFDYSFRILP